MAFRSRRVKKEARYPSAIGSLLFRAGGGQSTARAETDECFTKWHYDRRNVRPALVSDA